MLLGGQTTASFNMVPVYLGALCGCPPSSGTNWQCQASHDEGKSGLVETGLTRPAATALYMRVRWKYCIVFLFQKYNTSYAHTWKHIIGLVSQSVDAINGIQTYSSYSSFCLLPVHTLVSFWTVYTLLKLKCNSHLHFKCNVYSAEEWVTCWAKLTECHSDLQIADKWLWKLLFICYGLYMWLTWCTSTAFHVCWHTLAHKCLTMSHNSWPYHITELLLLWCSQTVSNKSVYPY